METPKPLRNSTEEQTLLRAIALWAANYAEEALAIFEHHHPEDKRPRQAIEAAREYGQGKKRDKNLKSVDLKWLFERLRRLYSARCISS